MNTLSISNAISLRRALYRLGALAAVLASAIFLLGGLALILRSIRPGVLEAAGLLDNWLLILLQLNLGLPGFEISLLSRFNPLDLGFLFLMAVLHSGLYVALRSSSRTWSFIALVQPFLGMLLFCLTAQLGRSAVMGAMLAASAIMPRSRLFDRLTAMTGIAAALLLLIGDLGTTAAPNPLLAASLAAGYVLIILWTGLTGRRLSQLAGKEVS